MFSLSIPPVAPGISELLLSDRIAEDCASLLLPILLLPPMTFLRKPVPNRDENFEFELWESETSAPPVLLFFLEFILDTNFSTSKKRLSLYFFSSFYFSVTSFKLSCIVMK